MVQARKKDVFDKLYKLPISRAGDRAPRIPITLKVLMRIPDTFHHIETVSINISRTGILLAVPKSESGKLALGRIVDLTIDLDCEYFAEKIDTPAKVVRYVQPKDATASVVWIGMTFV